MKSIPANTSKLKNRYQFLTMKFYLIAATTILLSSCLKESIPDAMLGDQRSGKGGTATLSYELNGNPVKISVANANQDAVSFTLGCRKSPGLYVLSGLSVSGETTFLFYTDSLTTMEYTYRGGEMFFISYDGQNEFVQAPTDYLSFTITSYDKGYISGTFLGQLTPLISAGNPNNIFGTPSSIKITKGSFKNVPVFY